MEMAMPTTVAATVMIALSSIPSQIASARVRKSGLVNAAMKATPRSSPS